MSVERLTQAHRYLQINQLTQAQSIFESLRSSPDWGADALNGLALCAEAQEQLVAAEALYQQALQLQPDNPEFINNLAICLQKQNRLQDALSYLERLARLVSQPEVHYNLVSSLIKLESYWRAIEVLVPLIESYPHEEAFSKLSLQISQKLYEQGNPEDLQGLQRLASAFPAQAAYQLLLANWYKAANNPKLTTLYLRSAISSEPRLFAAYRLLIQHFQTEGKYTQAFDLACQLLEHNPSLQSKFDLLVTMQDPMPASPQAAELMNQQLEKLLDLWLKPADPEPISRFQPAKAEGLPFYHSYQLDDHFTIQRKLGSFMQAHLPVVRLNWQPNPKPRIGIFSLFLRKHSVMDFLGRSTERLLSSPDFESYLFYYFDPHNNKRDQVSEKMMALADQAISLSNSAFEAAHQMLRYNLDILIFLDIGMDAYSYTLAVNRLARFQLALLGHPVTTGLTSIDYYISAEPLEVPESQQNYTESLVCLPGLPNYPRPDKAEPSVSRASLGLPSGNLYFCPMTIFKLSPSCEEALAEILKRDPEGKILLLAYKKQAHLRLQARFAERWPELSARLYFLPWSRREVFFQRLQAVDLILDTFPFAGGNTSYQALALGRPVLTLQQNLMKGRWTQALYQQMQAPLLLEELVAHSPEDYVDKAVGLAQNKALQTELSQTILAHNQALFDDPTWTEALHDFCLQLVQQTLRP